MYLDTNIYKTICMKKAILSVILSLSIMLGFSQEELSPYFKVSSMLGSVQSQADKVIEALKASEFEIIGQYHPESNDHLFVIAYTRADLKELCLKFKDRGALAATLKIGFVEKEGKTTISMLNPAYMFYAYFLENTEAFEPEFLKISADAINAMRKVGAEMMPFGGSQSIKDLKKYHYKMMMPYFTDPVELNKFNSFEEGLKVIRENLKNNKGFTVKVYEQVFEEQKIAVFGVALQDVERGESNFLPKIGEENIAAMPYDIILQGNEATMLHGKFRFALYWPELTMGTFMKIMSTPGNVKDFMEDLTTK